ncbi:helix-turn-helix domain-containing protein [Methylomonas fluvii]|uniref:Helix-turn-helix transcriptional regulator n=1 Tax=Methylomonas fluvii TaxID=1854564 RepID=A0ABR9D9V4_9GAMM|nr:helix-turn-helix transcriptional regulator [Methylomonas fluvii]MBD9359546.1 helix-turn-helix transcriptional regulator [Methylomonas fluvii]CAD6872285.1 helix-turn-helix domain-containing protein [Methylomonas fluvii]
MSVQFIEQNGQKQYAVVPVADYEKLLEKAEMLDDIATFDQALASEDELVPAEIVNRLLNGENKIKVWREHRGLTQAGLAESCNMAQASIAQIECGKRTGTVAVLKKIAEALGVDLDDLV